MENNQQQIDHSQLSLDALLYALNDPSLDRESFESRLFEDPSLAEWVADAVVLAQTLKALQSVSSNSEHTSIPLDCASSQIETTLAGLVTIQDSWNDCESRLGPRYVFSRRSPCDSLGNRWTWKSLATIAASFAIILGIAGLLTDTQSVDRVVMANLVRAWTDLQSERNQPMENFDGYGETLLLAGESSNSDFGNDDSSSILEGELPGWLIVASLVTAPVQDVETIQ
jgi:hypothetical protein